MLLAKLETMTKLNYNIQEKYHNYTKTATKKKDLISKKKCILGRVSI